MSSFVRLESLKQYLTRYIRGRITVVIGDELCSDSERQLMYRGICSDIPAEEVKPLTELYTALRKLLTPLYPECIVFLCINNVVQKVFKGSIQLYTCSSGRLELSKHRLDSFLKCVSIADTLLILRLSKPMKPVVDVIPLAIAMGKRVVVFSRDFRDFDGYSGEYVRIEA